MIPARHQVASGGPTAVALGTPASRTAFWTRVLAGRAATSFILCIALSFIESFGPSRFAWSTALAVATGFQNLALRRIVRSRGALPAAVMVSDYAFALGVGLFLPTVFPWAMLILATTTAFLVVGYPSRFAYRLIGGAAAPYLVLCAWQQPWGWQPAYAIWLVCSLSTVAIVGVVAREERALRDRYTDLLERLDVVVWESTRPGDGVTYVNERVEEMLGHTIDEWRRPGFWPSIVHPTDAAALARARTEAEPGASQEHQYRIRRADGTYRWVLEVARFQLGPDGSVVEARGVLIDVTERRNAQQQAQQLGSFVEDLPLALSILRLDRLDHVGSFRYLAANRAACRRVGRSLGELLDTTDGARPSGIDADLLAILADVVRSGTPWRDEEFELEAPDGTPGRYAVSAVPLGDQTVGVSIEDVTARTAAARALEFQARHDPLTGLPNRAFLHEHLTRALGDAERNATQVALMFMDLNQFKEVNDALGHHHGDRLLVELGKRIGTVVGDTDVVARLGGDEFAVTMTDGVTTRGALETARRIAQAFEQPVVIDGITLQTGVSIGIAMYPDHAADAESLTQRADVAMYKAKSSGIGVALYSPDQDHSSVRRLTLLGELRNAVDNDELVVHYQPRIDLVTGRVIDVEALVRWQHPTQGLLMPAEFIELAEVSGMIQPLTRRVLELATADVRAIGDRGHRIGVAVNLSVRNLYDPRIGDWIATALEVTGLDPTLLRVEITESELMDDPSLALDVLRRVRERGIEVSIDDFGTGYSSLSYLRDLPITEIKIDRSFVAGLNRGDSTLVRSIIDLGHNLGLAVVAEGVESGPVLRELADHRCDSAQGYFIAKPMTPDDLEIFLNRGGDHYVGWLPRSPGGGVARGLAGRPTEWEPPITQR